MCGIIAYIGQRQCQDLLFQGLRKLEYRGYDSAGLSVLTGDGIELVRAVGNLDSLERELKDNSCGAGTLGLGHTRWATHGRPSTENAHPHLDCSGSISIVLNGIIRNYQTLPAAQTAPARKLTSEPEPWHRSHPAETS